MKDPITQAQKDLLHKMGIGYEGLLWKGHASRVIDVAMNRRKKGLATPGQMRMLRKLGIGDIPNKSFDDARNIIGDSYHW
jgi:hypothetical protein